MGTCISRCDCSCTRSISLVLLPQQQQQELPQPTIKDKLVILSSSPLPSTYPLADSSSSSPTKPPPPSSPSLSSTPSTNTTSNRSRSISCTSSTLSSAYASSSASSSTSTYTSSSASSWLGRSFSDKFQWSNVRKHQPNPRRSIQPTPSQQQQKAPAAVPHKKPPPSWHRVAPTNTSPCPQLQKSLRKEQRISSSTGTTSERECVSTSAADVGKARCSSNNCKAKTHNRGPDGAGRGVRPRDLDKKMPRSEKVRQKKTESRLHQMMDVPALLDDDQIGSSHRCPGEDNDNSIVTYSPQDVSIGF